MKKLTVITLILAPIVLLAQTNVFYVVTPEDEAIRDTLGKFSIVKLLIVPVVTVFVMAVRKWIMLIPDQLWPWITPFIGVGLEYLGEKLGFWTGSTQAGAMVGALAVWFSQLGKQTKEASKDGFSITKSGDTEAKET